MNKNTASLIKDAASVVVGCAIAALGIVCFTAPNNIAPGGVSGLATAGAYITDIPIGTLSLVLNVPIFYVAFRAMGAKALLKSAIATVLLSVFIDLLSLLPIQYTGNILLSSMFGGALLGFGIGLLLTRNISTGGSDLLGLVLNKKSPHLSLGTLVMILDGVVVGLAVLVFKDIEVALYSVVTIFVCSKVIDALVQGVEYAKIAYVITEKPDEIVRCLTAIGRGATEIFVRGGYTKDSKSMVMTVTPRRDIGNVHKVIKQCDSAAFVVFVDATEVRGEGFKELGE